MGYVVCESGGCVYTWNTSSLWSPKKLDKEKEMATHSSTLAWRVPWMEEPGGLPSQELHRVGHDWSDLAAAATKDTEMPNSEKSNIPR